MKIAAFALSLFAAVSASAGCPESSEGIACLASTEPPIVRKLNGIIIDKVDLRNVTVSEAIEFLRKQSQRQDPEGTGVNFVLKLPAEAKAPVAPPPAAGSKSREVRPK